MEMDGVVQMIMRLQRNFPPRPSPAELEAASRVIGNYDRFREARIEAIGNQVQGIDVPDEVFSIYQEMQRQSVNYRLNEQKRDASKVVDIENMHIQFDDFIQFVTRRLPSSKKIILRMSKSSSTIPQEGSEEIESSKLSRSRSFSGMEGHNGLWTNRDDAMMNAAGGQNDEKLDLSMLARAIDKTALRGMQELNLQGRLTEEVDFIPDTITMLLTLITLNLSENNIQLLPMGIGVLSSLVTLDLHSNRIVALPESIGGLVHLVYLDLSRNRLKSLPNSIERLVSLEAFDLSNNELESLPYTISSLHKLKLLDLDHNFLTVIPYTISNCFSLQELRARYNRLTSLPGSVAANGTLKILLVRYNSITHLPDTLGRSVSLEEVDISFNRLGSVPDSFCSCKTLVRLDISSNFECLKELPPVIGDLENLEELNMSHTQIKVLPQSFRKLSKLRVLNAQENPLQFPPMNVVAQGAEAVVQYLTNNSKAVAGQASTSLV